MNLLIISIGVVLWPCSSLALDCSKTEHDRCVRMADPLIKQVRFIFPDNMNDVDFVCRTWNNFVDCLRRYTERCFTEEQRRQFNKAVENPIESVHQMCTQPVYQREYLQYAPCMKDTVTDKTRCGIHYGLLADLVAQGDVISKATLCCSHDRFKRCVTKQTTVICDKGVPDGPASRFAAHIVDKALSFLQDQCHNYIPNSGDCHSSAIETVTPAVDQPSEFATQGLPLNQIPPEPEMTSTWFPSLSTIMIQNTQGELLGSRSRPASYGRSNSWSEVTTRPPTDTDNTYIDLIQTTPSPTNEWAVVSTRRTINQTPEDNLNFRTKSTQVTETWYPAAGSQLSNEVDEPNQQGLSKPKNSATSHEKWLFVSLTLIVTVLTVLTVFC